MMVSSLDQVVSELSVIVANWDRGGIDLRTLGEDIARLAEATGKCAVRENQKYAQSSMYEVLAYLAKEVADHTKATEI